MVSGSSETYRVRLSTGHETTVKIDFVSTTQGDSMALILAHGASNNLDFPLLQQVAGYLAKDGAATVVRFNFPYAERGSETPDSWETLQGAFLDVYRHVATELLDSETPIILGGKSLGARTAAELVSRGAEGEDIAAAGLLELGYPLHRPGQKDRLSLEPLRHIGVPSLFFVGTRDPFCDPELLGPVLAGLAYPGKMHVVQGGDHSFYLPSSAGESRDRAYPEICHVAAEFIREVSAGIRHMGTR